MRPQPWSQAAALIAEHAVCLALSSAVARGSKSCSELDSAELWVGRWEDATSFVLVLGAPRLMGTLGAHMWDQLHFLSVCSLPGTSGSLTKRWRRWQHPLKQ